MLANFQKKSSSFSPFVSTSCQDFTFRAKNVFASQTDRVFRGKVVLGVKVGRVEDVICGTKAGRIGDVVFGAKAGRVEDVISCPKISVPLKREILFLYMLAPPDFAS